MESQNFHNKDRAWVSFFHFTKFEMEALTAMAKKEIVKRKKQIIAIENNPKNEGQVSFSSKIEKHENIIIMLEELTSLPQTIK